MFVGEAPGADEDQQGEPFVGRAGQLLTKIIEAIGLTRSDVYIANVIKCRPPGNRNPEPAEVATCSPFLLRQIDIVRPEGDRRARHVRGADAARRPTRRSRGCADACIAFRGGIKLVPTFHPAYLLRSPDKKRDVWEDMKLVRGLLDRQPTDSRHRCRRARARARPAQLPVARRHARAPPKGARVNVPLGTRTVTGCVVGTDGVRAPDGAATLRDVVAVLDDEPFLPPDVVDLALWVGEYYACGPGDVLTMAMPPSARRGEATSFRTRRPRR